MAGKAPGKSHRKGLSLIKVTAMFPDDAAAEKWIVEQRWPDGPYCPRCGSFNVQSGIKHPTMTHRCRDCPKRPMFSLKTGTIMEGTKLGYRVWVLAVYLLATNLKSVSSMKLHRDLDISQKSAWYLAHRIRESWKANGMAFMGPVEADETYMGGKRKNMPRSKRKALSGRGPVGKTAVAGIKDRTSNRVKAEVVEHTDAETLQAFILDVADDDATVYTDDHKAYRGLPVGRHEAVRHSTGEYVRGQAHTNGMESFWSMLKRGYQGTFHHFSEKHTDRYVTEFAGRHNARDEDTLDQMVDIVRGMNGKRLKYEELVA